MNTTAADTTTIRGLAEELNALTYSSCGGYKFAIKLDSEGDPVALGEMYSLDAHPSCPCVRVPSKRTPIDELVEYIEGAVYGWPS